MSEPLLSILIVNWNSGTHLNACLRSIFRYPPQSLFEVIVVDNASSDESMKCVSEFENVTSISNRYNFGFSYANNQAFELSSGDLILPLNPDTVVSRNLLSTLVDLMIQNPEVGIICPLMETDGKLVFPDYELKLFYPFQSLSLVRSNPRFPTDGTKREEEGRSRSRRALRDCTLIRGTGYVARRTALRFGYLFQPRSFLFGEEFHLCRAVSKAGFRIVVAHGTTLHHAKGISFKSVPDRKRIAAKLLLASHWDQRETQFGSFLSILSHLTRIFDLLASSLILQLGRIARRKHKNEFLAESRKFRNDASVFVRLLIFGRKEFIEINRNAAKFFNHGNAVPMELSELWNRVSE